MKSEGKIKNSIICPNCSMGRVYMIFKKENIRVGAFLTPCNNCDYSISMDIFYEFYKEVHSYFYKSKK